MGVGSVGSVRELTERKVSPGAFARLNDAGSEPRTRERERERERERKRERERWIDSGAAIGRSGTRVDITVLELGCPRKSSLDGLTVAFRGNSRTHCRILVAYRRDRSIRPIENGNTFSRALSPPLPLFRVIPCLENM